MHGNLGKVAVSVEVWTLMVGAFLDIGYQLPIGHFLFGIRQRLFQRLLKLTSLQVPEPRVVLASHGPDSRAC